MQKLQVNKSKSSGNIWNRKPVPDKNGIIVEIGHLVGQGKCLKFTKTTFSPCGEQLVAVDQLGTIILFDLHKNRYTILLKASRYCTAIAFPSTHFVVAAFADSSVKVIDTATHVVTGELTGQMSPVTSFSSHEGGRYLLSCSNDSGVLWDLNNFTRKRTLAGAQMIGLKDLLFVPKSNVILTCFRDDSVFAWDCESLEHLYTLYSQAGEQPAFNCFTATPNGDFLVAGGRSRYLHVWRLSDQKLHHIVELPERVKSVKQLVSLPQIFEQHSNSVFGALTQDGVVRFISLNTYKIILTIGGTLQLLSDVSVSPNSRHIGAVTEEGLIQVISVKFLTKSLHNPPPPLIKALTVPTTAVVLTKGEDNSRKRRCVKDFDPGQITKIDMKKLKKILKGFGEYPEKYRQFIWRLLLKIPENSQSYSVLLDKGTHSSFEELHSTCPVKSAKLMRVLQRVLSCLAHWSSIFGVTDYIPMMAFPFVKMFQNNHLVCFEVITTFILNWCQQWCEFFPHPPVNILTCVENLLNHHDSKVLQHLSQHGISSKVYCWPLLYTVFSEVLTGSEWQVLFDHVFSNHPGFLLCVCAAYVSCSRHALMRCTRTQDFEYYFHNQNRVSIKQLILESNALWETCPSDIHPRSIINSIKYLPTGDYPVYNEFPEKVVNYQLKERERIYKEEMEYIKQRQLAEELKCHTAQLQQQEEGWRREQELLSQAEKQRRKVLVEEENKLTEQRVRLQAMKRELRIRELQVLDTARRNFMENAQREHGEKLKLLEDDIQRKVALRDFETKTALEDVALKELEIETQKGLLEQELARGLYTEDKRREDERQLLKERDELQRRQAQLDEASVEDLTTFRVQEAQHALARSAVKSLSMKQSIDSEQAKHIGAIYDQINLANIHQKQSGVRTEREELETKLREATKDMHEEILEQRKALEQQKAETQLTENRISELYDEMKNMRDGGKKVDKEEVILNRRRSSLDSKEAEVLQHVHDLRQKLSADARRGLSADSSLRSSNGSHISST